MKHTIDEIRAAISLAYGKFESNRSRLSVMAALTGLVFALIIGAGYRGEVLKEKFKYQIGNMAWVLSMASTYTKTPGMYNSNEIAGIVNHPENYVYTSRATPSQAMASIQTDIGYPLLVRFMLGDDIKGVDSIAWQMARYQMMADLLVVVALFFAGYRTLGPTCAVLAAFLYALFRIAMVQMSFVEYYYWPIPLSALSILGLTFVFGKREGKHISRKTYLAFFAFGLIVGIATFIRLIFFNLSFLLLPLIYLREAYLQKKFSPSATLRSLLFPSMKKTTVLFSAILIGQMIFTLPIFFYNYKYNHKFALSDRQFWHLPLQGIGLYKNDWGIMDSGDVSINEWAMARGAPSYMGQPPEVLAQAEKWHRDKYFEMVRENPQFFWDHFKTNFSEGLVVNRANFRFYGLFEPNGKMFNSFVGAFPWMVLLAVIILALMRRNEMWIVLAVMLQGLYLLLLVVSWFGNYPNFIAGYIPAFVMLLAVSLAVYLKAAFALLESLLRCWLRGELTTERVRKEFMSLFLPPLVPITSAGKTSEGNR